MNVEQGGAVPKPDRTEEIDLSLLCHEAVQSCGPDDWHRIEHYVTGRIGRMSREQRDALLAGVSRTLRYEPPRR
jgi:hypothetical protein